MLNQTKKESYAKRGADSPHSSSVLKVGLISAISALAAGLAAAWWYRKTLSKLQNSITSQEILKTEYEEGEEKAQ